jgi:hypothetical protein
MKKIAVDRSLPEEDNAMQKNEKNTVLTDDIIGFPTIPDALPQDSGTGAMHPLSNELIARALGGIELKYSINEDGALLPVIPGSDMHCRLQVIGDGVLKVFCTVPQIIPQENWLRALLAFNEYHGNHRFGRCYLSVLDSKTEAKPYFDNYIDLAEGVTQTHLERLLFLNLYGSHVVFETIFKKHHLHAGRPRKRSKTSRNL